MKMMNEETTKYYKNSLCFPDLSEINIYDNWYHNNYKNLILTIDRCKPNVMFPGKCADIEKIDEWFKKEVFYMLNQRNKVNYEIGH